MSSPGRHSLPLIRWLASIHTKEWGTQTDHGETIEQSLLFDPEAPLQPIEKDWSEMAADEWPPLGLLMEPPGSTPDGEWEMALGFLEFEVPGYATGLRDANGFLVDYRVFFVAWLTPPGSHASATSWEVKWRQPLISCAWNFERRSRLAGSARYDCSSC